MKQKKQKLFSLYNVYEETYKDKFNYVFIRERVVTYLPCEENINYFVVSNDIIITDVCKNKLASYIEKYLAKHSAVLNCKEHYNDPFYESGETFSLKQFLIFTGELNKYDKHARRMIGVIASKIDNTDKFYLETTYYVNKDKTYEMQRYVRLPHIWKKAVEKYNKTYNL